MREAVRVENLVTDDLIAGGFPIMTEPCTVTGGAFKRGTVMGRIGAGGKFTISRKTASDGSQTPSAVLLQDVDATAGDAGGQIYTAGAFQIPSITLDPSHTLSDAAFALRQTSIFLKNPA